MEKDKELVNHPSHYSNGKIECIDAMIAAKGIFKTIVFCETNAFKYNWRQGKKDKDSQEVAKQLWYLNYEQYLMHDLYENEEAVKIYEQIKELCNKLDEIWK